MDIIFYTLAILLPLITLLIFLVIVTSDTHIDP